MSGNCMYVALDSSDDDVFISKQGNTCKQKTIPKDTKTSKRKDNFTPKRKKRKKIDQKQKTNNSKLNQNILQLFKRQKRNLDAEIVISDDSIDFTDSCNFTLFKRSISGKSTTVMKYNKDENNIQTWVDAAALVQDEISSAYDLTQNNIKDLIPTANSSETLRLANTQTAAETFSRTSSPDLFDCEHFPENERNCPNAFTNLDRLSSSDEYIECEVDVHEFLVSEKNHTFEEAFLEEPENKKSNSYVTNQNGTEKCTDRDLENKYYSVNENLVDRNSVNIRECDGDLLSENIYDLCWKDALEETNLENKNKHDYFSTSKEDIIVESHRKPAVSNAGKKQSTITSFFGGKDSKRVLTFVDTKGTSNGISLKNVEPPVTEEKTDSGTFKKGTKICPFYKKITGSKFCVDAFSYGSVPGIEHYFLSHFHADHYIGLNKHFKHTVYCSKITGDLVALKLGVAKSRLKILPMNQITTVDGVDITPIDANHCPGSVMFLFYFPSSGRRILHTGDFRFHTAMTSDTLYSPLQNKIHQLYLDTTYLNPSYNFPPQEETLRFVREVVTKEAKADNRVLVVCGSYTIGKEKVFLAAADVLDCSVWAQKEKQRVLGCLESEVRARLVSSASLARVHVLPMQRLTQVHLRDHLKSLGTRFSKVLAFKPTGWTHSQGTNVAQIKPTGQGDVQIYGVPYSEHSSFGELEQFVKFIVPDKIIPTVNIGKESSRNKMNAYFQAWLKKR